MLRRNEDFGGGANVVMAEGERKKEREREIEREREKGKAAMTVEAKNLRQSREKKQKYFA
jgi:hypothetical protein